MRGCAGGRPALMARMAYAGFCHCPPRGWGLGAAAAGVAATPGCCCLLAAAVAAAGGVQAAGGAAALYIKIGRQNNARTPWGEAPCGMMRCASPRCQVCEHDWQGGALLRQAARAGAGPCDRDRHRRRWLTLCLGNSSNPFKVSNTRTTRVLHSWAF